MVTGTLGHANHASAGLPDANTRIDALEAVIGVTFTDRRLPLQALLHRSAVLERQRDGGSPLDLASNERLEFLGDAILSMLIARIAFDRFSDAGEGMLTEIRAALVRRSTLAILAEDLGLGAFVYMGRSERTIGGRGRKTVLAEALEAVLAAIYLDQGLDAAARFTVSLYADRIEELLERSATQNAKSRLQELAQGCLHVVPNYKLLAQSGPAHDSRFEVMARAGEYTSTGHGSSIRQAEQHAAAALITVLDDAGFAPVASNEPYVVAEADVSRGTAPDTLP